jgi:hypothetical protein
MWARNYDSGSGLNFQNYIAEFARQFLVHFASQFSLSILSEAPMALASSTLS